MPEDIILSIDKHNMESYQETKPRRQKQYKPKGQHNNNSNRGGQGGNQHHEQQHQEETKRNQPKSQGGNRNTGGAKSKYIAATEDGFTGSKEGWFDGKLFKHTCMYDDDRIM